MEELPYKAGDHSRICSVGILPASEYIKITQTIGVQTIQSVIQLAVLFTGTFGKRIRR